MGRKNPQVEQAEMHIRILKNAIASMRADPGDVPFGACGNSCVVATCDGMGTNSSCSCSPNKLRRAAMYWRRVAIHRQAIIQDIRNGL